MDILTLLEIDNPSMSDAERKKLYERRFHTNRRDHRLPPVRALGAMVRGGAVRGAGRGVGRGRGRPANARGAYRH